MKYLRPAIVSLLLFSVLTGLLYPLAITAAAQLLFPGTANGSVVMRDRQAVGSRLIGQEFTRPGYFWSRLSATADHPYNGLGSSGSNLGPSNPALLDAARARIGALKKYAVPAGPVPVDLVTASASGLDPQISPAAAYYQVPRVAAARHIDPERLRQLIATHAEAPLAGVLGEPRVNVLALNMALDTMPVDRIGAE